MTRKLRQGFSRIVIRLGGIPLYVLLGGATLVALIPFAAKPFHMDDPSFLAVVEQIRREPLDFYGGTLHWYKTEKPLHLVQTNPPLFPYFLAAASLFTGINEIALHLAAAVPAVGAVLGIAALAGALGGAPWLAAAAAALCPAFLVSATTLMPDVLSLCFWVWACFFWVTGFERGRGRRLWFAGVLVAAAALSKFIGITLVPLLAALALYQRRPWRSWIPPLLIPAAALLLYHLWTRHLYGVGHLAFITRFTTGDPQAERWTLDRLLTGLSMTGGSLAPVLILMPLWARRRELFTAAGGSVLLGVVVLAAGVVGGLSVFDSAGSFDWSAFLHLWVFVSGGAALFYLVISDLRDNRAPASFFLLLWVFGIFAFTAFVNWTTNARSVLFMAPAAGILIARRMKAKGVRRDGTRWLGPGLLLCGGLSVWIAMGDYGMALASRRAVDRLSAVYQGDKSLIRFQGHWGFQYYMEKAGFLPVDFETASFDPGDLVFVPLGGSSLVHPKKAWGKAVWRFGEPAAFGVSTMAPRRAGFYSSLWGPLPFVFGDPTGHRFYLFQFTRAVRYPVEP